MKKRTVITLIVTMMLVSRTAGIAQSVQNNYALGVQMGFSSFWASKAAGEQHSNVNRTSFLHSALQSLGSARDMVPVINAPYGAYPVLKGDEINQCYDFGANLWSRCDDENNCKKGCQDCFNRINGIRDSYTAQFASLTPDHSYFGHAYLMGVNIAIAEAQATVGDDARVIVLSALNNAKSALVEFNKQRPAIDIRPLDESILFASGTTPMTEVYSKILSLRTTYQSLIK